MSDKTYETSPILTELTTIRVEEKKKDVANLWFQTI